MIQALDKSNSIYEKLEALEKHEKFNIKNPNKVRSLFNYFALYNTLKFHDISGKGYKFIADKIIQLNEINPHMASNLLDNLCNFNHFDNKRQELIKQQLKRIAEIKNISSNLKEKLANVGE